MKKQRVTPRKKTRTVLAAALVSVLACASLQACTGEPQRAPEGYETTPLRLLVDPSQTQQVLLGELYSRTMSHAARQAFVDFGEADSSKYSERARIEKVSAGQSDITVVCMGKALSQLYPDKARELAENYKHDVDSGKVGVGDLFYTEKVYDELAGALPENAQMTGFALASGCEDGSDYDLPNNYVPVFTKPVLNRRERDTLNIVSGALRNGELEELEQLASQAADPGVIYMRYLRSHNLLSATLREDDDSESGESDNQPAVRSQ